MHNITLEILERTAALAVEDAAAAINEAKLAKQNAVEYTNQADLMTRRARIAVGVWREALADHNKTIYV